MARYAQQVLPFKKNFALKGAHQPADGQQGSAFARAVGPKNGDDFAFFHPQVDAVQHFNAAVTHAHIR